jgi:hypothetical protein
MEVDGIEIVSVEDHPRPVANDDDDHVELVVTARAIEADSPNRSFPVFLVFDYWYGGPTSGASLIDSHARIGGYYFPVNSSGQLGSARAAANVERHGHQLWLPDGRHDAYPSSRGL